MDTLYYLKRKNSASAQLAVSVFQIMRPPKPDELSRVLWLIDELEGCVRRLELRPELIDMILTLRNGVSQELAEVRRNSRNSLV
jgi:hypothetical protein